MRRKARTVGEMEIPWVTAFLDFPASVHGAGVEFWTAATGQTLSAPRGPNDEVATLVPVEGDDYLRVQRIQDGPARIHLDLHTAAGVAVGRFAENLGARLIASTDYSTYLSPGGLPFCVVGTPNSVQTPPVRWGRHTSLVDQVCIDIPDELFESETEFWAELLGFKVKPSWSHHEFASLVGPDVHQLRLLMQRLEDDEGPVRAHLDLATDDRPAEVARLARLGAETVRRTSHWTTMRDPAGMEFCVTDRDPITGLPGGH
ncbi:MAG: hypothetical protein JWR35_1468 [Marmoricola sp.]|nr:hypothetical protein [Marmoricola sp.]